MNNAEWIKLMKKQREREEAKRTELEEVNNESVINNGDGNNNGSDAGANAGGEGDNNPQPTELDNASGASEAGSSDNGDA